MKASSRLTSSGSGDGTLMQVREKHAGGGEGGGVVRRPHEELGTVAWPQERGGGGGTPETTPAWDGQIRCCQSLELRGLGDSDDDGGLRRRR